MPALAVTCDDELARALSSMSALRRPVRIAGSQFATPSALALDLRSVPYPDLFAPARRFWHLSTEFSRSTFRLLPFSHRHGSGIFLRPHSQVTNSEWFAIGRMIA